MFRISIGCIFIVLVLLQFFLSKRTNGLVGLILPGLNFIVVTGYCLPRILASFQKGFSFPMLSISLLIWLAYNLTTVVLLVIYQYERKRKK